MNSMPPSKSVPYLAGMTVLNLRKAFEELVGSDTVVRALNRVSPKARDDYEAATPISWVLNESVSRVHEAIADEAGADVNELVLAAVEISVDRLFKTVWRIFLRFTSDEALIQRTPILYSRSRSLGEMTSRMLRPGIAEVMISGWPTIPDRDVLVMRLAIERFLILAGRSSVSVTFERAPGGARYRAQWKI